jgi:hypothetical protein
MRDEEEEKEKGKTTWRKRVRGGGKEAVKGR